MKNPFKKSNVKPCKNRDLMIPDHTALSGQGALIMAAVLVSWCALALGTNTAQAQSPPPYPIGVWGPFGVSHDIPPGLVNNLGIVGILISEDWDIVNPAPGVYDWHTVDDRIAQAKAAGFNYIGLAIIDSSADTPTWVLDSLPPDQKIDLLDIAPIHTTFCQPIHTALYWNPTFHQARLDLIAAAGAKYTSDPAIVAVNMAAFANHDSNDWNIQDTVGTIHCPHCPQPPPTLCGNIYVDQPAQWIAAGWTDGSYYDTYTPGFNGEPYIKYMIRAHAHPNPPWTIPRQAGLQMVSAATLGATTNCRQDGGPDGPCGPTCPPVCVMQASLDVARTYNTAFIEIWAQDAVNPDFYTMIRAATIAMGGTPRH